jgi:hypothetical protein
VVNAARASLRLLHFGFYDESLGLARSVGEAGNLLFLFMIDKAAFTAWRGATRAVRMREYKPTRVRQRLLKLLGTSFIDDQRYSRLSELAIHVTPNTKPQAHNILGIPTAASIFQDAGVLMSLTELGLAVAISLLPVAWLLEYPKERKTEFRNASVRLVEALGAIDSLSIERMWDDLRKQGATKPGTKPDTQSHA